MDMGLCCLNNLSGEWVLNPKCHIVDFLSEAILFFINSSLMRFLCLNNCLAALERNSEIRKRLTFRIAWHISVCLGSAKPLIQKSGH